MKDIPAIGWFLGVFLLLAGATIIYGRTGPSDLPAPASAWEQVERIRQALSDRQINIQANATQTAEAPPFLVTVGRLEDLKLPEPVARYVVRVRTLKPRVELNHWFGEGVDVALIDEKPSEPYSALRIVTLRRVQARKEAGE